jgi:hypothetical protein
MNRNQSATHTFKQLYGYNKGVKNMNTSKMKAARMIACYGARKQTIARIIGARRTTKLLKSIVQPDWRGRVYVEQLGE